MTAVQEARRDELVGLIEYHEKNIIHIESFALKEEVAEYRNDMYNRIDRTRGLLSEWKQELMELTS